MYPSILAIARLVAYGACLSCVTYTSLVAIRALDLRWSVGRFLALGVLNCSQIVLVVEFLSLLEAITLRNLVLAHAGVTAILLAFKCRSASLLPERPRESLRDFLDNTDWPLRVLLAVTLLAGAVTLFLALYVPPNNHDSMTYHLARAGYYLQQHSLKSYPTANIRQTVFPANAEVLMLWQVALLRNDRTVALVQWLSWLGSIVAVYGIARQLRAPPKGALFAALAFASFPEIVLQSTSTQNDLATAFFLLCAFAFVGEVPAASAANGLLAGTSLGLAVGTKSSALLMLPGFGIYAVACLIHHHRFTLRRTLGLLSSCLMGFLVLGSYFYFQNLSNYGAAMGPARFVQIHTLDKLEWGVAWSNFGRLLMQFLNPNGVIPPWGRVPETVSRDYLAAADSVFRHLGIRKHLPGTDFFDATWSDYRVLSVHEDLAMFGPVFGWVGLAVLFFLLVRPGHLRQSLRSRALALASIAFLILVVATLRWQLWFGRLMVPMVAIGSPLLAWAYLAPRRRTGHIWNTLAAGACVGCLFTAVLLNEMKPIFGSWTIWGKDRIQLMTLNRPESETMIRLMDRLGLNGMRIGVVPFTPDAFEYPLFGRRFERCLVPIRIDREELLSPDSLPDVDYLLFEGEWQEFFPLDRSSVARGRQFGIINLRPLIDALRNSRSGWHALVDIDGFMHLFAGREGVTAESALSLLPDFIPGSWCSWSDHWVRLDFTVPARIDPDRPTMKISGDAPALPGAPPTIKVEGPDGKILGMVMLPTGQPFDASISLVPLVSAYGGKYAPLRFTSNLQFNPKKLGLSDDPRDLSWRLLDMQLTSGEPVPARLPEYYMDSTWWSDKWVGDRFRIDIRIDSATPVLEIEGEMPVAPFRPQLCIASLGRDIAIFDFDQPGRFARQISLASLVSMHSGDYVPLEFISNYSFNPKKLNMSSDNRDLSWRLYELSLVPR